MGIYDPKTFETLPDMPGTGPVCLIFADDDVDVRSTVEHHLSQDFDHVILFHKGEVAPALTALDRLTIVTQRVRNRAEAVQILNAQIDKYSGRWLCFLFNAEYLYFPFMQTRSIRDLTAFMEEERRQSIFTYVVDLYAENLETHPDAVDRASAHFDGSGYYGFQRYRGPEPLERQFDIYGGLGWRFEEFIPWDRRRIDRIAIFKAVTGLRVDENLHLNEPEMNTISCPWHHNVTVAIASFRVAKSLKRNPGSMFEIDSFMWRQSVKFEWTPEQLLRLGFMEAGQWF